MKLAPRQLDLHISIQVQESVSCSSGWSEDHACAVIIKTCRDIASNDGTAISSCTKYFETSVSVLSYVLMYTRPCDALLWQHLLVIIFMRFYMFVYL
jgi:hypothetical protein